MRAVGVAPPSPQPETSAQVELQLERVLNSKERVAPRLRPSTRSAGAHRDQGVAKIEARICAVHAWAVSYTASFCRARGERARRRTMEEEATHQLAERRRRRLRARLRLGRRRGEVAVEGGAVVAPRLRARHPRPLGQLLRRGLRLQAGQAEEGARLQVEDAEQRPRVRRDVAVGHDAEAEPGHGQQVSGRTRRGGRIGARPCTERDGGHGAPALAGPVLDEEAELAHSGVDGHVGGDQLGVSHGGAAEHRHVHLGRGSRGM